MELILFIIFLLIVGFLIYRDRKNIKLEGILIIRRTKKGKKFIEATAKKHPKLWNIVATIGIIISVPVMLIGCIYLIYNAFFIIQGVSEQGVSLVLPGPVSSIEAHPGILVMPWWLWVFGVATVVIPHEFFHGIIARTEKIRIKSLGWLLLLFLPGAFCEPDENQLKKSKPKTKMKVYAAGSSANLIIALFVLITSFLLLFTFYQPSGLVYRGVINGYPSYEANLTGVIKSINDMPINSVEDLTNVLTKIEPNTKIQIETTDGIFNLTTVKRPDGNTSFIGIAGPYQTYYEPKIIDMTSQLNFIMFLLTWVFILNLGIGMINLLPVKPFDGGFIFETILRKFMKKKTTEMIVKIVSLIVAGVLVFNIIGPYIV